MATAPEALRLLDPAKVATILGMRREAVVAMIEAGELPCVRVGQGRDPRVSLAMLEAWQTAIGRGELDRAVVAPPRNKRKN